MNLNECPNCKGTLRIVKKRCSKCGLQMETDFDENPLVLLPRQEQDFLLEFILCGGSFKSLAEKRGVTYPTVRSHLDRIINQLGELDKSSLVERILNDIDQGNIKPEEGIEKIKKIQEGLIP